MRLFLLIFLTLVLSCSNKKTIPSSMKNFDSVPGTFAYDLAFLNQFQNTVVLSDSNGQAKLIIIPGWQARVMTSSANGDSGFSYGWINYKLIESRKPAEHMNAFGGEERLWLGPEGGPFSVYFASGKTQDFANWYVPAVIDTESFDQLSVENTKAAFSKKFSLTNYSGTKLDVLIERTIELLDKKTIESTLGFALPEGIMSMAYQSDNVMTNQGSAEWNKKTGMLSIWMLSMFNPSPAITIFIPYRDVNDAKEIPIINDDYFGKISPERLIVKDGTIWFKADGKFRSKLGVPPQRATGWAGSYDAQNGVLTLLWCDIPEDNPVYVNSKWGAQTKPFSGDALNAYNDGPVEDGSQMGPFYELESSSPAANLKPGENIVHQQRIYHFEGDEEELGIITRNLLGIDIQVIKSQFKL